MDLPPRIELADTYHTTESYMFEGKDITTGFSALFRWNAYLGLEWVYERGATPSGRNTFVVNSSTSNSIFVTSAGTANGRTENIIGAVTVNGKLNLVWEQPFVVPFPSPPFTTDAHDFMWVAPEEDIPLVAFMSHGMIFVLNTYTGQEIKSIYTPSGLFEAHLRSSSRHTFDYWFMDAFDLSMRKVQVQQSNGKESSVIVVFGNVRNGGFAMCVYDITLTNLISNISLGYNITLPDGDTTVDIVKTHEGSSSGFSTSEYSMFVSGSMTAQNDQYYLWSIDMLKGSLNWRHPRHFNDRLNMPVVADTYSLSQGNTQVLVTLNQTLQSIDPATGVVQYSCKSGEEMGCAGTPAVVRDHTGKIVRFFCASVANPNAVIGLNQSATASTTNYCSFVWKEVLPDPVDVLAQNKPEFAEGFFSNNPFVTFVTESGKVYSASIENQYFG